jgi:hypothetical protein
VKGSNYIYSVVNMTVIQSSVLLLVEKQDKGVHSTSSA